MAEMEQYKCFLKNCWLVLYLYWFGGFTLIIGTVLISIDLPWWAIVLIDGVALCLIVIGIIATVVLRCSMDVKGITVPISHGQKKLLLWNDIISVQITCSNAYIRYQTAYILEFKSNDLTVNIKTYKEIVNLIKEFSRDSDSFQSMFLESLTEAEKSC